MHNFSQVRESSATELRLNETEVEIMLDYFKYGKEKFSIEEMAFIDGKYILSTLMSSCHLHFISLLWSQFPMTGSGNDYFGD